MPHTPGPWRWEPIADDFPTEEECLVGSNGFVLLGLGQDADGDHTMYVNPADKPLIAQAPAMYELLKELEWSAEHHLHYSMCPVCYEIGEHSFDCKLAAVLKAVEGT
jgi:hypothetical protein